MPDPVVVPDPAPDVKPGWKTTEAWATAIGMTISILYSMGVVHVGSQADHWIGIVCAGAAALGYTVSRSWVKANQ